MAITVVKKKVTNLEKVDVTQLVAPDVVDEFAKSSRKLAQKLEKIAPLKKSVESQERSILKTVDDVIAPSVGVTLHGHEDDVVLGAKGKKTELTDAHRAYEILGPELFFKLVSLSITDLKKYMTPEQVAEVTKTTHKTKRRVKIEAA